MNHAAMVEENALVVWTVLTYQDLHDKDLLVMVFDRVLPVTDWEIRYALSKLRLPLSYKADMRQDAFIKLASCIDRYDKNRNGIFIAWWRICIHNHLLSKYSRTNRLRGLPDVYDPYAEEDTSDSILLHELCDYADRFVNNPLLFSVIHERIFRDRHSKTRQRELAERFNVSQGYVSKLERIFRARIRSDLAQTATLYPQEAADNAF